VAAALPAVEVLDEDLARLAPAGEPPFASKGPFVPSTVTAQLANIALLRAGRPPRSAGAARSGAGGTAATATLGQPAGDEGSVWAAWRREHAGVA
jgi:hypothetical protein